MADQFNGTQPAPDTPYKLKFDPTSIGTTGLRIYGGYVNEEFLKELRGWKGASVYREMSDNDPIVGAVIFAISHLIRQIEWRVQAVEESEQGEEAKEFVEEVMTDMDKPWSAMIGEIASMFVYGFAPMEIIYKKRGGLDSEEPETRSAYSDNKIGIRNISLRAQNTIVRWATDPDDGTILGLWQQPISGHQIYIPMEKMLLFRTTEERNNPEGRSILRNCYRPWFFKKRIEEIEGIGIERDLAGLPVAYIPGEYFDPSADSLQKATRMAWQTLVTNIRRDQQEGVLMPSDRDSSGNLLFDLKLLSTGGTRSFDTSKVVDRYNKAIATSVLADFVLLGQGATGSFALSSNKTEIFATAIGAYTQAIADVFNRHLLPKLWTLNALDPELMPTIVPGDIEKADLAALSDFVVKMTQAGATMFPDRELENHLRKEAGLPPAPEDGAEDMNEADALAAQMNGAQSNPGAGNEGAGGAEDGGVEE